MVAVYWSLPLYTDRCLMTENERSIFLGRYTIPSNDVRSPATKPQSKTIPPAHNGKLGSAVRRNDPCPCGKTRELVEQGKPKMVRVKWKHCCGKRQLA